METLVRFSDLLADPFLGPVNMIFALAASGISLHAVIGSILSFAFATSASYSNIAPETLDAAKRWHGSIDDKFVNIDNLVVTIQAHASWGTPTAVFKNIAS